MDIYFPVTAFIDGQRYRQGLRDFGGDVSKLPGDARIGGPTGQKISDTSDRKLQKAKKDSDKADSKPAKVEVTVENVPASVRDVIIAEARKSIEDELRPKIVEELKADKDLRAALREELKSDAEVHAAVEAALRPQLLETVRGELKADKDFIATLTPAPAVVTEPTTTPPPASGLNLDEVLNPKPKTKS